MCSWHCTSSVCITLFITPKRMFCISTQLLWHCLPALHHLCHVQVPTLLDAAAAPPSKPAPKGITKPPSGKAAASKAAPASTAVAAAAAAASNALSVVHETAAGYNLYCPAGLYQLSLKHPGAKHLFDQLMALRALLQQLQQQAKDQHAQQQQQQQELEQAAVTAAIAATAAAAARNADTVSANPRAEPVVRSRSPSRRVSRANSPMPSEPSAVGLERAASTHAPGTSSPSGMASRRVSRTASTMARARPGAQVSHTAHVHVHVLDNLSALLADALLALAAFADAVYLSAMQGRSC